MVTGHPYLETKHWERNIIIHMWCVYIIYYIILYTVYVYTVYKYVHPDMFSILRSSDSDIFLGISSDTYSDIYHISYILAFLLPNIITYPLKCRFCLTSSDICPDIYPAHPNITTSILSHIWHISYILTFWKTTEILTSILHIYRSFILTYPDILTWIHLPWKDNWFSSGDQLDIRNHLPFLSGQLRKKAVPTRWGRLDRVRQLTGQGNVDHIWLVVEPYPSEKYKFAGWDDYPIGYGT